MSDNITTKLKTIQKTCQLDLGRPFGELIHVFRNAME
jgi:hypothetical protein